jgi:hypothetical protein
MMDGRGHSGGTGRWRHQTSRALTWSASERSKSRKASALDRALVGGGSCQAVAKGVFGLPVVRGPVGFVEPLPESAVGGLGAHTDGMRPPDHDHGSVGVVRAAVVAKGRPPN